MDEDIECPNCEGLGWVGHTDELGQGEYECPYCCGSGYLDKDGLEKLKKDKAEWWLISKNIITE